MSRILFHKQHNELFTIQLRDDPFVKKWLKHLQYVVYDTVIPYPCKATRATIPFAHEISKDKIIEYVDQLHITIKNINNLLAIPDLARVHTDFPISISDLSYSKFLSNDLETQKILNALHRCFTCADKAISVKHLKVNFTLVWSDKFKSNFRIHYTKKEEFRKLIQDINQIVHCLDCNTITPRVFDVIESKKFIDILTINFDFYGENEKSLKSKTFKFMKEKDMLSALDSDEYDVWMGVDLLGKDYITGYYNHDDPTEWDISTLNCYTGKMEIVIGPNTIPGLVKSNKFQNWLKKHNVEYTPGMCGIPLGKVISGKDFINNNSVEQDMAEFKINILK